MPLKRPVAIPAPRVLACIAAMAAMTACHAPGPTKPVRPAPLQMIGSDTLTVPDACSADGSVIVAFTVYENGRTGEIQPAAAPACLQQALTAWVASFRYSPPSAPVPATLEWLLVEAKKGS